MILGLFSWRWRVQRLRKKWDRCREKALKKKDPLRSIALKKLDAIESSLVTIEEQRLGRLDRARLARQLEIDLTEIKELLRMKAEEAQRELRAGEQQ